MGLFGKSRGAYSSRGKTVPPRPAPPPAQPKYKSTAQQQFETLEQIATELQQFRQEVVTALQDLTAELEEVRNAISSQGRQDGP